MIIRAEYLELHNHLLVNDLYRRSPQSIADALGYSAPTPALSHLHDLVCGTDGQFIHDWLMHEGCGDIERVRIACRLHVWPRSTHRNVPVRRRDDRRTQCGSSLAQSLMHCQRYGVHPLDRDRRRLSTSQSISRVDRCRPASWLGIHPILLCHRVDVVRRDEQFWEQFTINLAGFIAPATYALLKPRGP